MESYRRFAPAPLLAALSVFAAISLALALFGASGYSWAGWAPDRCQPDHCFCEALQPGPIVQPSNTYSNLGFVLVGLLVALPGAFATHSGRGQGSQSRMAADRAYPLVFGLATIWIGLGSIFFHASLTAWGGWLDVSGMFLLASLILLYNLSRLLPLHGRTFAALYAIANVPLMVIAASALGRIVFATLIVAGIVLEVIARVRVPSSLDIRFYLAALASFALAYAIWLLDINALWCQPQSWLQGHAIWHLLGAGAAGLLFRYYRSEREPIV